MARVLAVTLMAFALLQAGALGPAADLEVDSEVDRPGSRPKGARPHAHERALAEQQAQHVASTGCVNLGGDNWFADAHGELFHVTQDRCQITFALPAKSGEMYEKRGIIRGYMVHVEPPFPDGQVVHNQSVMFENGAQWEHRWP